MAGHDLYDLDSMAADERRISQSGFALRAGCVVAALIGGDLASSRPTMAQTPLDYFFGRPGPRYYRALPHRRGSAPPQAADVPLPVPRPHFPGDAPPPVTVAVPQPEATKPAVPEKSEAASPSMGPTTPAAPQGAPSPAATDAPKPAGPAAPLPPEKPTDLSEPTKPAVPAPQKAKPEEAATPPETPAGTPPAKDATAHVDVPPPAGPVAPTPPPKPPDLAKPTEPPTPGVAASGARLGEAPGQPVDDAACPGRLKTRNVEAEPISIGPQPDPRCTVVEAVRLSGMTMPDGGKVAFPDHPTIACATAETFSTYVRDLLGPLAKGTFSAPLDAVWTGPGLECRSRDHIFGAKLSAHGQGLAIDIAQLKLGDGRTIEVGTPKTDQDQGFETAARAAACGYFHTVLGPGSDAYHRTHWHFDLEVRGAHGDSKYCK